MAYRVCRLNSNIKCRTFTGLIGDLDLNGNTIVCASGLTITSINDGFRFWNETDYSMNNGVFDVDGGAVVLSGDATAQLQINNLDFNLATEVLGTAYYCDVLDSVCTYVTAEMDATDPSNADLTGNTGWNFGEIIQQAFSLANIFVSKIFKTFIGY